MPTEPRIIPLIPPEKRVETPPHWTPEETERWNAAWDKVAKERREAKPPETERK